MLCKVNMTTTGSESGLPADNGPSEALVTNCQAGGRSHKMAAGAPAQSAASSHCHNRTRQVSLTAVTPTCTPCTMRVSVQCAYLQSL